MSAVAGAIATIALTFIAIYLAEFPSSSDKGKAGFVASAAVVCIIWIASVFTFWFCENRLDEDRQRREDDRDANSRELMRLVGSLLPPITGSVNVALESPTVEARETFSRDKLSLRQMAFEMANSMRKFARENESRRGDLLLEDFWKAFPFKSYDDLKERFKNHLGRWNVESAADILPTTSDRIIKLADNIESEASKIASDIPF